LEVQKQSVKDTGIIERYQSRTAACGISELEVVLA
jgi:hypothetical protein